MKNFITTTIFAGLVLGGLIQTTAAQHKYVFPQFVFGGGWTSGLTVFPADPSEPAACIFSAHDREVTIRDHVGNLFTSELFSFLGDAFIRTESDLTEHSSGMAVLECDREVLSASVLFSWEVDGRIIGEALVEPAEEIEGDSKAYFYADYRGGSRLALAIGNDTDSIATASIVAIQLVGPNEIYVDTTVVVPPNSAKAFFVDELGAVPEGQIALTSIGSDEIPLHAIGLKFSGTTYTTLPGILYPPKVIEVPDTPSATVLETSQEDPNGRWTATAAARVTEKNDTYWEFSHYVDMTNPTDEEQEYSVRIHFLDAGGFSVGSN